MVIGNSTNKYFGIQLQYKSHNIFVIGLHNIWFTRIYQISTCLRVWKPYFSCFLINILIYNYIIKLEKHAEVGKFNQSKLGFICRFWDYNLYFQITFYILNGSQYHQSTNLPFFFFKKQFETMKSLNKIVKSNIFTLRKIFPFSQGQALSD